MEKIELVIKTIRNLVWGLVIEGLLSIVAGVLIFAYPALLGMLVGLLLVIAGIIAIVIAIKLYKYSKIKIEI